MHTTLTLLLAALTWLNLDDAHKLGGRKVSEGYLRGKTVFVCRDQTEAQRMEDIWLSFKTKPFVMLGSFKTKVEECSFPMYAGAEIEFPPEKGRFYVVDETGHVYYHGDSEQNATQALVMALTDAESPKTFAQFKKFLDWEIKECPGAASNRFLDLKKRFPEEAAAYKEKERALKARKDVRKLAELVDFAKRAKDLRPFDPKKAATQKRAFASKLNNALIKYASLKESEDPQIAQEAKNSLADIKWTLNDVL